MDERQMTLAMDLRGTSVDGWFGSEKFDGCRAYWDGKRFWTRGGKIINAPKWFTKGFPDIHLDGEIFCGRDGLVDASNATRLGGKWFDVSEISFKVFDAPQIYGNWIKRLSEAAKSVKKCQCAEAVQIFKVRMTWPSQIKSDEISLCELMLKIKKIGGEGAMFRNPDCQQYEKGRSENLLRLKFCSN